MTARRRPSLAQALAAALDALATTLQPSTLAAYRWHAAQFLAVLAAQAPGIVSPAQLHRRHLQGWLRSLYDRQPPLARGTRHHYIVCLRRLLQDLARQDHVTLRPDLLLPDDVPPLDRYLPRPLAPEDDQRLQTQLRRRDDRQATALLLLRLTGMRIGECVQLAPDCLRHLGGEQWALHVPLGKLHTDRWIPADAEIRSLLARLQDFHAARTTPDAARFLLPQAASVKSACQTLRIALARLARQAGCAAPVTPHQLRHSFATEMLRAGMSLPALQALLGHQDIRMTLRYTQVSQTDLQQQYQLARQHVAVRHPLPPLPVPPASLPELEAGILAITQALAAARHLMEMYRRQLTQPAPRGALDRLENRLSKIIAALGQLPDPAM